MNILLIVKTNRETQTEPKISKEPLTHNFVIQGAQDGKKEEKSQLSIVA
jgi:hypothetical protein